MASIHLPLFFSFSPAALPSSGANWNKTLFCIFIQGNWKECTYWEALPAGKIPLPVTAWASCWDTLARSCLLNLIKETKCSPVMISEIWWNLCSWCCSGVTSQQKHSQPIPSAQSAYCALGQVLPMDDEITHLHIMPIGSYWPIIHSCC